MGLGWVGCCGMVWVCVDLGSLTMFTRAWDGFGWVCGFEVGFGEAAVRW